MLSYIGHAFGRVAAAFFSRRSGLKYYSVGPGGVKTWRTTIAEAEADIEGYRRYDRAASRGNFPSLDPQYRVFDENGVPVP